MCIRDRIRASLERRGVYVHWLTHLYRTALNYTYSEHPAPLDSREIHWIARSVAHWVWTKFDIEASDRRFSARQAARGRRGGLAKGRAYEDRRSSARIMRAKGLTQAKIAEALGVTERTVRNWIRGTGK